MLKPVFRISYIKKYTMFMSHYHLEYIISIYTLFSKFLFIFYIIKISLIQIVIDKGLLCQSQVETVRDETARQDIAELKSLVLDLTEKLDNVIRTQEDMAKKGMLVIYFDMLRSANC